MTDPRTPYPVRVDGASDPEPVSRWLWLVKWLLLVPHLVVLLFLWIAFYAVGIVAFFAILITAAGEGSAAAIAINGDLVDDDVRTAVHDFTTGVLA